MKKEYAPIIAFCYNRVDVMKVLFESLKRNTLSRNSDLFIFCDGPKDDLDKEKTDVVKKFVESVDGFRSKTVEYSTVNKGLAPSVIYGVSKVLENYDSAIVVEDDLILSDNFLEWMNQCLSTYKNENAVFSVSGFSPSIKRQNADSSFYDAFFTMKAHSWGWATWKDRWNQVDWELKDWEEFSHSKKLQKDFASIGNEMPGLLFDYKAGKKSTWWARFCYTQFKYRKYTVYPVLSKVINEGFTSAATHCDVYNKYRVDFDQTGKYKFSLPYEVKENPGISKSFFHYYSLSYRIVGKIKTYLMKMGLIKQDVLKIS